MPTSPWWAECRLRKIFVRCEVGIIILSSNSAWLLSTLRQCLTSQYSRTSGVVSLRVLGNPLCIVSMSLMYCGSLRPAVRMKSGEVWTVLLFAPNIAIVVVDATQSPMSSDSVTSDCAGLAGNTSSSDFNVLVRLREIASEVLCHFPLQCWIVNLYLRVFSFSPNNLGFCILLRSPSPHSPFSDSWSVTTMSLGSPLP